MVPYVPLTSPTSKIGLGAPGEFSSMIPAVSVPLLAVNSAMSSTSLAGNVADPRKTPERFIPSPCPEAKAGSCDVCVYAAPVVLPVVVPESISSNSKPPLEGYAAYVVPPTKVVKLPRVNRPMPAAVNVAPKVPGAFDDETVVPTTSSSLPVTLLPFIVMKPPAEKGFLPKSPPSVKANVPVGRAVLVCENASPERIAVESISINFKCVASIANTSNVPLNDPALSVVPGVEDGPN